MKIRLIVTAFCTAALCAGVAHAADNRIIFGPLTSCEQTAVTYCDRHYVQGTPGYDKCILDRFDYCNGKPALSAGASAGALAEANTAGVYVPPTKAPVKPGSALVAKQKLNSFSNRH